MKQQFGLRALNSAFIVFIISATGVIASSFSFAVDLKGDPKKVPYELQDVGVKERLGEKIDLSLQFIDSADRQKHSLSEYFQNGKPTILNLVYYECPMLCTMVLNGVTDGMKGLDWSVGDQSALPVELSSFSASVAGSHVKLRWETATEVNNYGFEVERKVGGLQSTVGNYEKVGFVNGNGNSNSPKNYSFEDKNVSAGKYSYRLKQIDNDGQFEYSKSIEVEFGTPKKFELSQNYPNPFNPTTTIRFDIPEPSNVKLTLFNILGQEIKTLVNEFKESGIHTLNFDASDLNSGMYIYKLEAGSFTQTRKMTLVK